MRVGRFEKYMEQAFIKYLQLLVKVFIPFYVTSYTNDC
jgi:hypothetical protein